MGSDTGHGARLYAISAAPAKGVPLDGAHRRREWHADESDDDDRDEHLVHAEAAARRG